MTTKNQGFYRKPVWIYLVSIALILAPFGNFLISLKALNVAHWWSPTIWLRWLPFIDPVVGALMLLLFVSGVSLFFVRKSSLRLAGSAVGATVVYTLLTAKQQLFLGGLLLGLFVLISAGLVFLFFFSPFRLPYLNPRLRWWETDPRYTVELPASVAGVSGKGLLVDISRSGALIKWDKLDVAPEIGERVEVTLPNGQKVTCEKVRSTENGYGFKFLQMSKEDQKELKEWLRDLELNPTRFAKEK